MVRGLPADWGTCFRTVELGKIPWASACWKDIIAVGLYSGDVITLDRITGSQTAIFPGCTGVVRSLAFSSDGMSLVSGSDNTISLWDVQTGGVIKSFHGHTKHIFSVSISADCAMIASGSWDRTIRLWDIQTEKCHHVIKQEHWVDCVRFSSTEPQHLISVSGCKVQQWNINGHQTNGHQISPIQNGYHVALSLDGAQLVLYQGEDIVVQNSHSGVVVARFHVNSSNARYCCFSPDGRLLGVAADNTVYVWDTTSIDPTPIKTFIGHATTITSLAFSSPSSLISSAKDGSVKFWQIGVPQTDPLVTDPEYPFSFGSMFITLGCLCLYDTFLSMVDWVMWGGFDKEGTTGVVAEAYPISFGMVGLAQHFHHIFPFLSLSLLVVLVWITWFIGVLEPTSLAPAVITSIILQAKAGVAISSDSDGIVRTWELSTGLCKASFQTPVKDLRCCCVQLVNNKLISAWHVDRQIHIWDVEGGKHFQITEIPERHVYVIRISGDGSKVFCLSRETIQAWSIQTGEAMGRVEVGPSPVLRPLTVDGSKVWIHSPQSEPLGWDFGISGSPPIQLFNTSLLPNNTRQWDVVQSRVKGTVTGKVFFQLAGRFTELVDSQWDGQYLVAGYRSGEVLILDFSNVPP